MRDNTGDCSLYVQNGGSQQVDVIHIDDVPICHFMKIDAEGAEFPILLSLQQFPKYLAFEFHRTPEIIFKTILTKYNLWSINQPYPGYGVAKLVLKEENT
jgi:hypothetical protein